MRAFWMIAAVTAACAVTACGGDSGTCDPVAQSGCSGGKVCEEVTGGTPACFAPVELRGHVFDLSSSAPIAGASVVALDVNGAPVGDVVVTGADGAYALAVPETRAADGSPAPVEVTLRADAAGYQSFPGGVRQALPIDTTGATMTDGAWVLSSSLTDVGLLAEPAGTGTGSIKGTVEVPGDHAGVLVVAETSAGAGFTGIADRDGAFSIFNLAAGDYTVSAYAKGHVYGSAPVTVAAGAAANAALHLTSDAAGGLNGQVSIVYGRGSTATSVVVFVESTFDAASGRGETPPGLRAPSPGTAPDVSGAFAIDGVPPGKYVVLAAFENDGLIRDPDTCIAGTAIVHVQIAAGQTVTAPSTFKVTGALAVMGPGADGPEAVTGTPTFHWADDSSEDFYDITVRDSFGREVWKTEIPGTTGTNPQVTYGGPALAKGSFYQFHVVSVKAQGGAVTRCPIGGTEDLRGVFFAQ